MADLSQRAQSLGTENAFVVLAEVNKPIAESPPVVLMVSVSTPAIVVATVVAWDMLETLTVAESAEPVTSEYVIV